MFNEIGKLNFSEIESNESLSESSKSEIVGNLRFFTTIVIYFYIIFTNKLN
jgi:hypothetical protein